MKIIKFLGLICLICFTFFYTEKIISVSIEQDEIMIKLKEIEASHQVEPLDAIIENDTIIPGNTGLYLDTEKSYKQMKKIGYFEESLITYKPIYPTISIHNNYNKYIIKGNIYKKNVSLIYIINNDKTIDDILNIISKKNTTISLFIDTSYLLNNMNIINKIKDYEIYNYGAAGKYTKDNLIMGNNIINNKAKNNSSYCLFLTKEEKSLNNCAENKMLSIIPTIKGNYNDVKNNLQNGSIILINNTKELANIIDYIKKKEYNIAPLANTIEE